MKKILTILFVAVTAMTFVSCDDDKIARSLDGIWEGNVAQAYFNYHVSSNYQYVNFQFYADPTQYARGTGVERDYSGSTSGYYTYTDEYEFTFEVKNGRIYLYYEDGADVVIRNYELHDDHFSGEFLDTQGNFLATFDLYRVTNWRHSRYDYYRYTANPDSTATFEEAKDTIK